MHRTIADAAAALARGSITAVELVNESLTAIERHNARTNAFTAVHADAARRAAREADIDRARGRVLGPLHGIPISLKDLIDDAGTVTTAGSRVLADRVPSQSATVVERLRNAGAIIIGRTNLHEFAFGTTSDQSAFGPVHHPIDPQRSAGGSSGGSAVAVALGMGLASIGTDTGGSIRIPAAACGVVGLKPAAGDIPTDGVFPLSVSLDHVGPLARTVDDAALLYDVLTGRRPAPLTSPDLGRLQLKQLLGYFDSPLEPAVRESFDAALAVLREAGCRISGAEIPEAGEIGQAYADVVLPEAAHAHARYLDSHAEAYTPLVHARLLHGRTVPAVRYIAAQATRERLRAAVDMVLASADAIVLPTLPILAPPLGAETTVIEPSADPQPVRPAMLKHTQLFNLSGHPAISLPLTSAALPVGLELVGPRSQTRRLLEIAAACERALAAPRGT